MKPITRRSTTDTDVGVEAINDGFVVECDIKTSTESFWVYLSPFKSLLSSEKQIEIFLRFARPFFLSSLVFVPLTVVKMWHYRTYL